MNDVDTGVRAGEFGPRRVIQGSVPGTDNQFSGWAGWRNFR